MFSRHYLLKFLVACLLATPSALFASPADLQTRLLSAAGKGDLPCVKHLLAKGAKVNVKNGRMTPLMAAAREGHTKVAAYLLFRGAEREAQDKNTGYFTALMYAKNYGCVKTLLNAGANASTADVDGESVLMRWLPRKNPEAFKVIRLLIVRGANVNCGSEAGETGLMSAVETGDAGIVRLMLTKGAKVNEKNDADETALSLAISERRANLVALLKQAGAKK